MHIEYGGVNCIGDDKKMISYQTSKLFFMFGFYLTEFVEVVYCKFCIGRRKRSEQYKHYPFSMFKFTQ